MSTVISLCDLTGHMVQPWVEGGHEAILVDPQHVWTRTEGAITRLALTVDEALRDAEFVQTLRSGDVAAVFGWPPCTDMAVSGAPHFAAKAEADPLYLAKAVAVAEQCRTIGRLSGAPWFVENPVSRLSSVWGEASYTFDPYEFTAWEPADNYTKRTCLWAGGGFRMPKPRRDLTLDPPDDRIHKAPPGPNRANFRSATPLGFARAVYDANRPAEEAAA